MFTTEVKLGMLLRLNFSDAAPMSFMGLRWVTPDSAC